MNVSRRSKPLLLSILLIAVVILPLTVYLLQKEQVFQNFAWFTEQSATSQCSSSTGTATLNATFSNTESSTAQNMNVVVNDLQTGTFVNMGTVKAGATKTVTIDTKKTSIKSGTVVFNLTWTSGASGTDSRSATYGAVNSCSAPTPTPTPNLCAATGQPSMGICQWDALSGTNGYNVVVKETDTGAIVQTTSTGESATQMTFPMTPGKPYQCTVTATNECGNGTPSSGTPITCPVVTPTPTTPTPTAPVCSPTQGICQWDAVNGATSYNIVVQDLTTSQNVTSTTVQAPATEFSFPDNGTDTYQCNVQSANVCGQSTTTNSPPNSCTGPTPTTPVVSPTPTPALLPSPTPFPTATPIPTTTPVPTSTPIPTPTPAVTITVLTQPPQQIVRTVPGQTQTEVVQGPNQTNVVVQPGQTQTVVVTRPPTPTMPATGSSTPTLVLVGTSAILLLAGGLIFFIL